MILGFISLLLTFAQKYIVQICIPPAVANTMLPCPLEEKDAPSSLAGEEEHHRRLQRLNRRSLAGGHDVVSCKDVRAWMDKILRSNFLYVLVLFWLLLNSEGSNKADSSKQGKVSLISVDGLHQLHILIFFLAVFHVLFCVTTMTLGRIKVRAVSFSWINSFH